MSVESDKLVYIHEGIKMALDTMYDKVDNTFNNRRPDGIEIRGSACGDDTHRILAITVLIPK